MGCHLPFFVASRLDRQMESPLQNVLTTDRLVLRPFRRTDAADVRMLCSNWKVASMVGRIPHPYPEGRAEAWIAAQAAHRAAGIGHVFAIERDGRLIGAVGLERDRDGGAFKLGYWLGEAWWRLGIATEAARRIVRFGFEDLGAGTLTSGHYVCNPASGRVLRKCGFGYSGREMRWCEARGHEMECVAFELPRAAADPTDSR